MNWAVRGTSSDDFAQALAGGGAVPSAVAELMLALFRRHLGALDDLEQHFGLLAAGVGAPAPRTLASAHHAVRRRRPLQVVRAALAAQAHRLDQRLAGARPARKKKRS